MKIIYKQFIKVITQKGKIAKKELLILSAYVYKMNEQKQEVNYITTINWKNDNNC